MADRPLADNETEVTIGGREYVVRASNHATELYAQEFAGRMAEPYTGHMVYDLTAEYKTLEDGAVSFPEWSQLPALTRAVWAMAREAGSTDQTWKRFKASLDSAAPNFYEPSNAFNAVVVELGNRYFFRNEAGQGAVLQADERRGGK